MSRQAKFYQTKLLWYYVIIELFKCMILISVERDQLKEERDWSQARIGVIVIICLVWSLVILIAIVLMMKQKGKYKVEEQRQQSVNADSNDLNAAI